MKKRFLLTFSLIIYACITFLCMISMTGCNPPEKKRASGVYNDYVTLSETNGKSYVSFDKWEEILKGGSNKEIDSVFYSNGVYTVNFIDGETTDVNESSLETVPYELDNIELYADVDLDVLSALEKDSENVKWIKYQGTEIAFDNDLDGEGVIITDNKILDFVKGERYVFYLMYNDRAYPSTFIFADEILSTKEDVIDLMNLFDKTKNYLQYQDAIKGKVYVMSNDIDIEKVRFNHTLNCFWNATFDGNGYAISNLNFNWDNGQSLFGSVQEDGTVRNLTIDTVWYDEQEGFKGNGGIVARDNYGLIENVCVKAKLIYYMHDNAYLVYNTHEGSITRNCLVIDTGNGREDIPERHFNEVKFVCQLNEGTLYHIFVTTSVLVLEDDYNLIRDVKNKDVNNNGELAYLCGDIFEVIDHAKSDTLTLLKDAPSCVYWGHHVIDE